MDITSDPTKVTQRDFDRLVSNIKSCIAILGADHPLKPTINITESALQKKPRINFTITKKNRNNYTSSEVVNYVLGDQDGTWEKLMDARRRLNIEAQRHETCLKRAADIMDRIGADDITWVIQYAIPRRLFQGVNYQEE